MKRISLRDIALRAGVSPTTVSFVLNGKAREKRVSREVIRRVEGLVKELGYEPNLMARGLRTGKTMTIGLMVEDISNQFFATLAKVIEDEADKFGYDVIYCSTENKEARAKKLLEMLKHRQVDGYILTPTAHLKNEIQKLLQEGKPLVLMDRYFPSLPTNYVVIDNFRGSSLAAAHLLDHGYQKLAIVTTVSRQTQMQQRLNGFIHALHADDTFAASCMELCISFEKTGENATEQIGRFLKKNRPDAVFFTTNYLGISGIEAIKYLGWNIPSQIGMVSFDDHVIFRLYQPAITCVAQPVRRIGECVIKVLMENINDRMHRDPVQHILSPQLIIRESCGESIRVPE